jgi:hypothetical protein
MARDILSEYGQEAHKPQAPRAGSGGITRARDVMNYSPPQGPTNIHDPASPGLHGGNHGMAHKPVPDADDCRGIPPGHGHTIHKSGSQRG